MAEAVTVKTSAQLEAEFSAAFRSRYGKNSITEVMLTASHDRLMVFTKSKRAANGLPIDMAYIGIKLLSATLESKDDPYPSHPGNYKLTFQLAR